MFAACQFCALSDTDRELRHVYLASRGNQRRGERHIGVIYPTARLRFADALRTVGIVPETAEDASEPEPEPEPVDRDAVLTKLAAGEISVDEAERLLRSSA